MRAHGRPCGKRLVDVTLSHALVISCLTSASAPSRSFIKMTLGAPSGVDVEALKAENEQLKAKCEDLEGKLADALKKLEEATPADA